jgi:5-deoxy-D-glucuronate isomerase
VIAAASPPNRLPPDRLIVRAGPDGTVSVDPSLAGWRYLSFEVRVLRGGSTTTLGAPDAETAVVLLAGGDLEVAGVGSIAGRESPFHALPSAVYVPARAASP